MELPALSHPERLWWLLLLLPLWLLALPPRPRRALWTAHLPQWLTALAAARRRPPVFRRWRFLLLALAACAGVFAHAGLQLRPQPGCKALAVVLDQSASMAAGAGARAAARLHERLAALPEGVELHLLLVGDRLQLLHGEAAKRFSPPPPAGAPAVPLAEAVAAAAAPDVATWLLTDGQHGVPPASAVSVCGRAADNWAIAEVAVVDRWPLPGLSLAVEVQSYAAAAATVSVRADGPVEPADAQRLPLEPGGRASVALELRRLGPGGPLRVHLEVAGDALAADDTWTAELPPLPQPRIAVLAEAEAELPLQRAAEALAEEVGGEVVTGAAGGQATFQLIEGGTVALRPGQLRGISFGTRPAADAGTPWLSPSALDWNRAEPLLRGLDFSELAVQTAWHGILPPGRPLLWAAGQGDGRQPLAVLAEADGVASLHFAFRLQDSNLWLLPAFPQLLRRALHAAFGSGAIAVAPGLPASESDLRGLPPARDGELPAFARPARSLAPLCLWLGLCCLLLRAWLR